MKKISIALLAPALVLAPAAARAQAPSSLGASQLALAYFPLARSSDTPPNPNPAPASLPLPKYGSWVGITKWIALGASAGLGVYGFKLNGDADDTFHNLKNLCRRDPDNCRSRNPDGTYSDPLLESLYQDALSNDNSARTLLIASQLCFGVSVVLFIVDFLNSGGPDNIPYNPDDDEQNSLEFVALPGTLAFRYYLK